VKYGNESKKLINSNGIVINKDIVYIVDFGNKRIKACNDVFIYKYASEMWLILMRL